MLELMTDRLTMVGPRVRQRILHQSQVEEVTSNKLQDLSYELDQQVWQFRAHIQSEGDADLRPPGTHVRVAFFLAAGAGRTARPRANDAGHFGGF